MFVIINSRKGYHQTGRGWVQGVAYATTYPDQRSAEMVVAFHAPRGEVVAITEATAAACKAQAASEGV